MHDNIVPWALRATRHKKHRLPAVRLILKKLLQTKLHSFTLLCRYWGPTRDERAQTEGVQDDNLLQEGIGETTVIFGVGVGVGWRRSRVVS